MYAISLDPMACSLVGTVGCVTDSRYFDIGHRLRLATPSPHHDSSIHERNNKLVWDELSVKLPSGSVLERRRISRVRHDHPGLDDALRSTSSHRCTWRIMGFCGTEKRLRRAVVRGQSRDGAESKTKMTYRDSLILWRPVSGCSS